MINFALSVSNVSNSLFLLCLALCNIVLIYLLYSSKYRMDAERTLEVACSRSYIAFWYEG